MIPFRYGLFVARVGMLYRGGRGAFVYTGSVEAASCATPALATRPCARGESGGPTLRSEGPDRGADRCWRALSRGDTFDFTATRPRRGFRATLRVRRNGPAASRICKCRAESRVGRGTPGVSRTSPDRATQGARQPPGGAIERSCAADFGRRLCRGAAACADSGSDLHPLAQGTVGRLCALGSSIGGA